MLGKRYETAKTIMQHYSNVKLAGYKNVGHDWSFTEPQLSKNIEQLERK